MAGLTLFVYDSAEMIEYFSAEAHKYDKQFLRMCLL